MNTFTKILKITKDIIMKKIIGVSILVTSLTLMNASAMNDMNYGSQKEKKNEYKKFEKHESNSQGLGKFTSSVMKRTKDNAGGMRLMSQDVVTNVVRTPGLSTLGAAVQAAGLVDTLKGTGPFTVFAPTNRAFNALPAGTVANLLKPENKKQLTDILTYHVVPGIYTSDDIKDGMTLTTVQGATLLFTIRNGQVFINGKATVVAPDVITSNGVIHVIGSVLLPPAQPVAQAPAKDIIDTAVSVPAFSTLVTAVQTAGLVDTLKGTGPFTVFAPDNAAFNALPEGTVANLLKPENKATLTGILTYHVVPGLLKASDLKNGQVLTTVAGKTLTVTIANGQVLINGIRVATPDVLTSNGVVHGIAGVLLP